MLKVISVFLLAAALLFAACAPDKEEKPVDIAPGQPVAAILVKDASCRFCQDLGAVITDLESAGGVKFSGVDSVEYNTSEGLQLVRDYNLTRVPAVLLSKEIASYPQHAAALGNAGISPIGDFYLLVAPQIYRETSTGRVRGEVNLTLLSDASCRECFGADFLKVLAERNFNMVWVAERSLDVSSATGKELIRKHNITVVPTILLTGDLVSYPQFLEAGPEVGTLSRDGVFVFRNVAALGRTAVYRDLSTGEIVERQ